VRVLFVGDDWAEDHHDVELVDDAGCRLARARLPEGLDGLSRLHALIAGQPPEEWGGVTFSWDGQARSRKSLAQMARASSVNVVCQAERW
jgi:hypothetical protein